MKASTYAEQVVNDVLKGTTGKVWRGSYASLTRYAVALLGESAMVSRPRGSARVKHGTSIGILGLIFSQQSMVTKGLDFGEAEELMEEQVAKPSCH